MGIEERILRARQRRQITHAELRAMFGMIATRHTELCAWLDRLEDAYGSAVHPQA